MIKVIGDKNPEYFRNIKPIYEIEYNKAREHCLTFLGMGMDEAIDCARKWIDKNVEIDNRK